MDDNHNDYLREFIIEKTVKVEGKTISRDYFRTRYNHYCTDKKRFNKELQLTDRSFVRSMKEKYGTFLDEVYHHCVRFKSTDWIPNYFGSTAVEEKEDNEDIGGNE